MKKVTNLEARRKGYKTFYMLNSNKNEISTKMMKTKYIYCVDVLRWYVYLAYKRLTVNIGWHLNILKQKTSSFDDITLALWAVEISCSADLKMSLLQCSKIALVRSYLRVPQAAGQVKILLFLVKI